jgi:hypothetical protein
MSTSRFWYIKKTWQIEKGMMIPSGELYAAAMSDIEYLIKLVENQNSHIELMSKQRFGEDYDK